jgi:hypothetical protein
LTCSQADGACLLLLVLKNASRSLLKTQAFDNTPQQEEKNIEKASKSLRSFSMYSQNKKKIICPQLIALLH